MSSDARYLDFLVGMHSPSAFSVSCLHGCLRLLARLLCRALCGCTGVVGRQVAFFCFVVPAVYVARLLACLLTCFSLASLSFICPCDDTFFLPAPLVGGAFARIDEDWAHLCLERDRCEIHHLRIPI